MDTKLFIILFKMLVFWGISIILQSGYLTNWTQDLFVEGNKMSKKDC